MKLHRRILVVVATLFCSAIAALAEPVELTAKANQEYSAGRFREAAELYQQALAEGATSAAVFYNLGNARYQAGDTGRAILNYARALALEPQHPEAEANLRVARDKARALQLPAKKWDRWISRFPASHYTIALAASFWIAAFALVTLLIARRRSRFAMLLFALGLIMTAASAAALYLLETGNSGRGLAIVVADKIEARVATADSSGAVLALPVGSELKILSTRGDWVHAALPNDLRGWIPANAAERVRL